jgi:hypothetical protein
MGRFVPEEIEDENEAEKNNAKDKTHFPDREMGFGRTIFLKF